MLPFVNEFMFDGIARKGKVVGTKSLDIVSLSVFDAPICEWVSFSLNVLAHERAQDTLFRVGAWYHVLHHIKYISE